jgi:hypothetical protein
MVRVEESTILKVGREQGLNREKLRDRSVTFVRCRCQMKLAREESRIMYIPEFTRWRR